MADRLAVWRFKLNVSMWTATSIHDQKECHVKTDWGEGAAPRYVAFARIVRRHVKVAH